LIAFAIQGYKESVALTQNYTFLGTLGNTTIISDPTEMRVIQGAKESVALTQSYTFLRSLGNMTKVILLIGFY
jgi:hypothetical protein